MSLSSPYTFSVFVTYKKNPLTEQEQNEASELIPVLFDAIGEDLPDGIELITIKRNE